MQIHMTATCLLKMFEGAYSVCVPVCFNVWIHAIYFTTILRPIPTCSVWRTWRHQKIVPSTDACQLTRKLFFVFPSWEGYCTLNSDTSIDLTLLISLTLENKTGTLSSLHSIMYNKLLLWNKCYPGCCHVWFTKMLIQLQVQNLIQ